MSINTTISPSTQYDTLRDTDILDIPDLGLGLEAHGSPLAVRGLAVPLPVGVLRANTIQTRSSVDGLVLDESPEALARIVKHFTGRKNRSLQEGVEAVIDFVARNPHGNGSTNLKKGSTKNSRSPLFNEERVPLLMFNPANTNGFKEGAGMRNVRLVYALVRDAERKPVVGLLDIINKYDFDKKYH